jgi:hypothetical protein
VSGELAHRRVGVQNPLQDVATRSVGECPEQLIQAARRGLPIYNHLVVDHSTDLQARLTTRDDFMNSTNNTRAFRMTFASVYPHYVAKAEKKGRTKEELHAVIQWLTGYDDRALQQQIDRKVDLETFFAQAPRINPNVSKITGVICGYRVEEIDDPLMRKIRYLDKLIDELARGRAMDKILRK